MSSLFNDEVRFEIVEHIGVLAHHDTSWTREINLVAWNDAQPKYDIRDWSPDHERMSKGITLTENEVRLMIQSLRYRGKGRQ